MSYSLFTNITGLGNDQSYLDQRAVDNVAIMQYNMRNFADENVSFRAQQDLMTSQPGLMFDAPYGDAQGYSVDTSSKITIGQLVTQSKCRKNINPRVFMTVPNMQRGAGNPVLESQMRCGRVFTSRPSVNHMAERDMTRYKASGVMPQAQQKYQQQCQMADLWDSQPTNIMP